MGQNTPDVNSTHHMLIMWCGIYSLTCAAYHISMVCYSLTPYLECFTPAYHQLYH